MRPEDYGRKEGMTEEHSFDELTRGLASGALSRRRALRLAGTTALAGALGVLGLPDQADARRRRRRRCSAIDAYCQGPPTGGFTGSRRFAQTFKAPLSGSITTAQIEVRALAGGEDFTLEIRQVDQGIPTDTVLASVNINNVPATPSTEGRTLVGHFATPAQVTSCQRIALSLTIAPGQGFIVNTRSACTGTAFTDGAADGNFIPLSDVGLISAVFITR